MIKINKRAIQLSMNFLVTFILAIVILGMGVMFFTKLFMHGEEIKQQLDEQTRTELQQILMSTSDEVVVYPTKLTIRPGGNDVF